MNIDPTNELVQLAQREIAAVLARLEKQTGALVGEIGIFDLDISNIHSGKLMKRMVQISMQRAPGSEWCT